MVHTGNLRGMHLFNNMSGDEGAGYIASVLARAPRLEDFKMASSRVGPHGGIALAKGLTAGGCWRVAAAAKVWGDAAWGMSSVPMQTAHTHTHTHIQASALCAWT